MKYYLTSLFILITIVANSQNYIKTLEENKTWVLTEHIGMGVQDYPKYHVSCDTTMNGYQYYKLWNRNTCTGYLREDTIAQRIYFISADFHPETLTVDYLLNPGDPFTFTYDFDPSSPNRTIVDTVSHLDTILINQVPHKRIHFLHMGGIISGPNLVFTEGRGDRFSGVAHSHPVLTNQTSLHDVYTDSTISCGLFSSLDDINQTAHTITIYPNPTQQILNIALQTERPSNSYFLRITNLSGQVISTKELTANADQISVEMLPKGLYFLHVFEAQKRISVRKFIKN
jgi:hypothetical protein